MKPLKILVLALLVIAILGIVYISTTDDSPHLNPSKVAHMPGTPPAKTTEIKKITHFFNLEFEPTLQACFLVLSENNKLISLSESIQNGATVNDLNSKFDELRFVCFQNNKRLSTLITPAYFNIQDVHYRMVQMEIMADGVLPDGSTVPLMLLPPESAAAINQEESKQASQRVQSRKIG